MSGPRPLRKGGPLVQHLHVSFLQVRIWRAASALGSNRPIPELAARIFMAVVSEIKTALAVRAIC
jgi:hypothetical protein